MFNVTMKIAEEIFRKVSTSRFRIINLEQMETRKKISETIGSSSTRRNITTISSFMQQE